MTGRHVLIANVYFAPYTYGGATVVAEQVAHQLVRQAGYRVSVLSMMSRSDLVPYSVIKSHVDGIDNYLVNLPVGRSYAELYDNPQITQIAGSLMDRLEPDLVHAHCLQDIGAGILSAAKLRDLPVVLSVHDFWWLCDRQFMIRPNQSYCGQNPVRIENCRGCVEDFSAARTRFGHLRKMSEFVDIVTYPSRFALDLAESSGFGEGKGVVWENGVCLPGPDFFEHQARRRREDPLVTFGFLGGPSHIKGWPLVRRLFEQIDRSDFRGYLLDGSLDESWWQEKDLSKLKGDWQIHPRYAQAEMDDFYAKIDVLLFLSQWKETFGLAIREAVARGITVIQTDSGGTVEHPAADPGRMIPIGAGVDDLMPKVLEVLDNGVHQTKPAPVRGFEDQTRQFIEITSKLAV